MSSNLYFESKCLRSIQVYLAMIYERTTAPDKSKICVRHRDHESPIANMIDYFALNIIKLNNYLSSSFIISGISKYARAIIQHLSSTSYSLFCFYQSMRVSIKFLEQFFGYNQRLASPRFRQPHLLSERLLYCSFCFAIFKQMLEI